MARRRAKKQEGASGSAMVSQRTVSQRTIAQRTTSPETGDQFGRLKHGGLEWSESLRIVGRDKPLGDLIANRQRQQEAKQLGDVALVGDTSPVMAQAIAITAAADDYVSIDLQLAIRESPLLSEEPVPGTGYGAFTPTQRFHFLTWLEKVDHAAPAAFRQLYLAHLESNLFDDQNRQRVAWRELLRLSTVATWQQEELLWRVMLLGFVLKENGEALAAWLSTAPPLPPKFLGVAVGQLALFAEPLTVELLAYLLRHWSITAELPERAVLQLRLGYLNNTLDAEPLQDLLTKLDPTALQPRPWRTAHRSLRLSFVQPDLHQSLMPLLRELAMLTTVASHKHADDAVDDAEKPDTDPTTEKQATGQRRRRNRGDDATPKQSWQLVLEFGDSRSEYFNYAINQAKRMPGYIQIMDENRRMVHRVRFEKTEMRRFWSIWEYVQSWSSTQIYVNGKELQKWEIYPYSPYLR